MEYSTVPYLRSRLLKWFGVYGRNFSWRKTTDPYKILIAEVMLQRTQARQVAPVYEKFIERFPDLKSLEKADETEVAALIYSLGLPDKPKKILIMTREINENFGGKIPETREELKQLTGVGDYIAGQVIAQAYRKNGWIVDTNVVRVFCRFFGLDLPGEARRSKVMIDLAQRYARSNQPHNSNLALLDFAAAICKPSKPLCPSCPVRRHCVYFSANKPAIVASAKNPASGKIPESAADISGQSPST